MERYDTSDGLRERLDKARAAGQRVGMVGTSGALHVGHLSLIRQAAAENDVTALFWGGGTAAHWMDSEIGYERDADRDFALAEGAGLDIIFAPPSDELFPRAPMTTVSLPAMSTGVPHLEDPAHLDLIAMVMCKLWNIFGPCRSYFGEKDWQQLVMYQRLADDLAWPIEVIGCPTVREDDGLAVSSRNGQLTAEERAAAPVLYRALCAARAAALDGARTAEQLAAIFVEAIGTQGQLRYFTPVEASTMTPLETLSGEVRLLASLELGGVRLLDNVGLEMGRP
ncbi:MAG TPA: pantoate--beta-alanine ligase [Thermoleophilia bacterium]